MIPNNYGGNIVQNLTDELGDFASGRFDLVNGAPYEYFMLKLLNNSEYLVDGLGSFTIYVLDKGQQAKIKISGVTEGIDEGCAIQCEAARVKLCVSDGAATMLVAGTVKGVSTQPKVTLTQSENIHKVTKPWGHELWINGQHPAYAIKQIFIKNKTKTSLQFHNFKQETNILFDGEARLHFKNDPQKDNLKVNDKDIDNVLISAISSIDVRPPILHRLEAEGDILLYEVSTAHLDDVIRVKDDTKRPDGRLEKEHGE